MLSIVLYVSFSMSVELIVRRAFCMVLDIRSVLLSLLLWLCCFGMSFTMLFMGFNPIVRAFIVNVLANLAIPMVMSHGPIGQRLTRIAFLNMVVLLTEIIGTLVYYMLSGQPFPSNLSEAAPLTITLVYTVLIFTTTITCEAAIALLRRTDDAWDEAFEPTAFIMMTSSFMFFVMLLVRFDLGNVESAIVPIVTGLGAILAVTISLFLLRIARQDAQAKREIALRAADKRQIQLEEEALREIEMEEAERMTSRSTAMRRIRHDLANQIGIVHALADQGRFAEADEYLSGFQDMVRQFAGPTPNDARAEHE